MTTALFEPLPLQPVGVIHSPFREKFGIPRQPGLLPDVPATLELLPPYDDPDCVRGLDGFSHLWLIFQFHAVSAGQWQPLVRPPRLGGNARMGVFASRSTHRPNSLGLSVVRLVKVETEEGVRLHISGADLLDGTPIFDIKPYLPYADAIAGAVAAYAAEAPAAKLHVAFTEQAREECERHKKTYGLDIALLIRRMLELDPRPAYHADSRRQYGFRLADYDVRWVVEGDRAEVLALVPVSPLK